MESVKKKKGGNFPPFDETEDLTSNNDDPKEILNSWFRKKNNIEFIDQISFQLTGKFHFMYNNKPIWNGNEIIKDVLDFKGRVQLSLLSQNKDNILERIKGNTPISGTWFNYEFLPEMLRISSMYYRVLANHYQALLLPLLTNKKIAFEKHVEHVQRTSLLSQLRIEEIRKIQKANDKGREAEMLVLEGLQEVFGDSAQKTHKYHNCDIEIEDGEILVEVKAVQTNVKADKDKFISDLLEHKETVHIGLYINIFDNHQTRYINSEHGFTMWFINPSDFTFELLNIIKQSNKEYNKEITLTRVANQKAKQIIMMKEIQEEVVERIMKLWELHEQSVIARCQLSSATSPNQTLLYVSDAKTTNKMKRDIQRMEDLPKFNELIKEFIKLHYRDFKNGYHTKECRIAIDEYVRQHGITSMGFDTIQSSLNSFVYIDRHPMIHNGPRCYFFIKGLEDQFKPNESINASSNQSENAMNSIHIPTPDETFESFISLENVKQILLSPDGFQHENIYKRYKYYIETQICQTYKTVSNERYLEKFSDRLLNIQCIQISKGGHSWYYHKSTDKCKMILKIFDDFVNEQLTINKLIKWSNIEKQYKELTNGVNMLTRKSAPLEFMRVSNEFKTISNKK